ncbi:MAG: hypothetical protein ACRAS9_01920 [Mycoplasma sp.]
MKQLSHELKVKKFNDLKKDIYDNSYLVHLIKKNKLTDANLIDGILNIELFLHYDKTCDSCNGINECHFKPIGNFQNAIWDGEHIDNKLTMCPFGQEKFEKISNFQNNILPLSNIDNSFMELRLESIKAWNERQEKLIKALRKLYFKDNHNRGLYIFSYLGNKKIETKKNELKNSSIGKSYIFSVFANQLAQEGKKVAYIDTLKLLRNIKNSWNKPDEERKYFSLEELENVDVIIFDNFGLAKWQDWFHIEYLEPILDHRMKFNKLTFFISDRELKTICNEEKNYDCCMLLKSKIERLIEKEISI